MRACRSAIKFHPLVFLAHPQHKSKPIPTSKTKLKIFCYPSLCLKISFVRKPLLVHAHANYSDGAQNGAYDRTVKVKLILHKECQFGEEFCAVGELESLGSWDPQGAVPMKWSPGHIWTTPPMDLPVEKEICFKFILRDQEGEIQWQSGPDRVFHSCETRGTLLVSLGWDDVDVQTTIEEEEGEEYEEGIAKNGVGRVEEGGIDGWVPVLVPGLKREADSGGEGECSSIENVAVQVPGLTTVMDDDRDSWTEESQNGAHEGKEEEQVSVSENSYAVFDNHASISDGDGAHEEKEEQISGGENIYAVSDNHASVIISNESQTSVVDEEEASTSTAMEGVENQDIAVSSESSCDEGEHSNSVNYPVDTSVLQKDFDWGRNALSKLIWSLGLKDE